MDLNVKLPDDSRSIIMSFIRSKVESANADGVVLGLSGGLDSAMVAKLCSIALGPARTHSLLMPERISTDPHFKDAEELAQDMGIVRQIVEIEPLIEGHRRSLDVIRPDDITLGNLKARIRAVMLYYYANSNNLLVAGTSNKSEYMLGYFTKYGDGASDIAPIGDLYKTQVRELAKDLDIPEKFLTKVPTAGLIKDQTDEVEIGMPYDILDRILLGLELQLTIDKISEMIDIPFTEVERINNMIISARHKRKFSKIPKIGIRTVGTDLRE